MDTYSWLADLSTNLHVNDIASPIMQRRRYVPRKSLTIGQALTMLTAVPGDQTGDPSG